MKKIFFAIVFMGCLWAGLSHASLFHGGLASGVIYLTNDSSVVLTDDTSQRLLPQ